MIRVAMLHVMVRHRARMVASETPSKAVKEWSLQRVQLKLVKAGARLVRHARRLVLQMAEVAVPREVWVAMLERIGRLRLVPG